MSLPVAKAPRQSSGGTIVSRTSTRMSFSETVRFAFGLVPAERTERLGSDAKTRSAVGLRHWFRLQMKRMLVGTVVGWDCCWLALVWKTESRSPVVVSSKSMVLRQSGRAD